MHKLSLIIAFRHFVRNPLYPILNIIGLTIGFLSFILICLWIRQELSYDSFHENADHIYRITVEINNPETGYESHFARSWFQWMRNLDEEYAGIEDMTRITHFPGGIINYNKTPFRTHLFYTDPSFFTLFSTDFIEGSPENSLSDPYTLIVTRSAAMKYFGTVDAVGKLVQVYCNRCPEKIDYEVTGVIEDFPETSHFQFDILAAYENPESIGWGYYYLLLNNPESVQTIMEGFNSFALKYTGDQQVKTLIPHIQALRDIHLRSQKDRELRENGSLKNVWLFAFMGFAILFLSLFNYSNLQQNQVVSRINDFKTMEVFGAARKNIRRILLTEIFLMAGLSMILSTVLLFLLPGLNNRYQFSGIAAHTSGAVCFILIIITGLFLMTILSGIYPWWVNSFNRKNNPMSSYQNSSQIRDRGAVISFTKILLGLQFMLTTIILVFNYFTYKQVNYMLGKGLGKMDGNILVIRDMPVQVLNKYEILRDELIRNPLVLDVTAGFEDPGDENMDAMNFESPLSTTDNEEKLLYVYPVDDNFFSFYNINMKQGRNFPEFYGNDSLPENYIINEQALKYMGWEAEDVIDKDFSLVFNMNDKNLFNGGKIIGVVEDFQPSSMKNRIKPYIFFQKSFWLFSGQIRMDASRQQEALEFIKNTWDRVFAGFPFDYTFVEDLYYEEYKNEMSLNTLTFILGILSLGISLMGLWAVTGKMFHSRTKEVGIRRVNGASVLQIFATLLKNVFVLELIAVITGIMMAMMITERWLRSYSYKTEVNLWVPLWIGLLILTVSMIVAGIHAKRVSNRNPVDSLRYE